jgi:hypothetical protein
VSSGLLIFSAMLAAWLVITVVGMLIGLRRKEHEHRERLAMIERGIAPPPEMYPNMYEAPPWVQGDKQGVHVRERVAPRRATIARKLGILICFGAVGIAWLLFVMGEEQVALGVGGLLAMFGLAFIAMSSNFGLPGDN